MTDNPITTAEELLALPIGTIVRAHWNDGSQPDYHSVRIPGHQQATTGGWALSGGNHWLGMLAWGADLTVVLQTRPA